ncbi:uncharacterized protein [Miscanthus floridulus]|uniref:uncharacterized protein n=1 Tax=Miscanthus floridulus TaxID=154761 RepID=UPI003457E223
MDDLAVVGLAFFAAVANFTDDSAPSLMSRRRSYASPPASTTSAPTKAAAAAPPRTRGLSMGPLDVAAAVNPNPLTTDKQQQPRDAQGLKPIKQASAAARVKPISNKLGAVREEGQRSKQHAVPARPWPSNNARHTLDARQGTAASRAKVRSESMIPSRRTRSPPTSCPKPPRRTERAARTPTTPRAALSTGGSSATWQWSTGGGRRSW